MTASLANCYMVRSLIIISLLLSLFFLVRWDMVAWQNDAIPELPRSTAKTKRIASGKSRKAPFYPPVAASLPDLNNGYLFNAARALAVDGEGDEGGDVTTAADETNVEITDVQYIGSIISKEIRRAIIAFPLLVKVKAPGKAGNRKSSYNSRRRQKTVGKSEMRYKHLGMGDTFNNYKVVAIEPDRLILSGAGGGEIIKPLFEQGRERLVQPPSSTVGGSTPPAEKAGKPKRSKSVVVGGTIKQPHAAAKGNKKAVGPKKTRVKPQQAGKTRRTPRPGPAAVSRSRSVDLTTTE